MENNLDCSKKTALVSVYDKKGIVGFVTSLVRLGWQILASGGTAKVLKEAGIEVIDVAELVGGGAILGHRVVTLSRELHAGLLADTGDLSQIEEMKQLGLPFIGLVCCDFYPLKEAIAKPEATIESVVEMTDIGGPTMVRAAAKGNRIVICDPADRAWVLARLSLQELTAEDRQRLRTKAEAVVAEYVLDSARFHSRGTFDGLLGSQVRELAYAENRFQNPASLFSTGSNDSLGWDKFEVLSGDPSYISIADGDRALGVMCLLARTIQANLKWLAGRFVSPYIAIACKHGNPCGVAVHENSAKEAILKAMLGDPIAVMGAEFMTNFPITTELATAIHRVPDDLRQQVGREFWGTDVVYAPSFDRGAIELLGKKEKRRLLANPALLDPQMPDEDWMIRPVRGGFLKQKQPNSIFVMMQPPTLIPEELISGMLAFAVAWQSVSNTVSLAKDGMLIGLGCGQQDRIACVNLCLDRAKRAGHDPQGSWFASDAFFPYAEREREDSPKEGPELLSDAGCVGGFVPRGSKNDVKVIVFFMEHGLRVQWLPPEHRGFFGH